MSVTEKLLERIETMTQADLEWLSDILEAGDYPDVRVDYSDQKQQAMIDVLKKLGAPSNTDMTEFNNTFHVELDNYEK